MKNLIAVILMLPVLLSFMGMDWEKYVDDEPFHFLEIKPCDIVMYAKDRELLVDMWKDTFKNGQTVSIYIGDGLKAVWAKESDIPFGDVYYRNGKTLLKYENNHGYMPVWRD